MTDDSLEGVPAFTSFIEMVIYASSGISQITDTVNVNTGKFFPLCQNQKKLKNNLRAGYKNFRINYINEGNTYRNII